MPKKSYDIVMVGAGCKSMTAACYLAKYANMSVCVIEDRHEAAGGWCSEEAMGGGFNNDPCSSMMVHWPLYFGPVFEDFPELRDYGLRFVPHPVGPALVTLDGRTLLIWSEEFDPDQEKTAESIAKWNKNDADKWLEIWRLWKTKWEQAYYEFLFNPIDLDPAQSPIGRLFANPKENGVDPAWLKMTPLELAEEIFESQVMAALLCRVADTGGYTMDEPGLGFVNLLVSLFWTGGIAAARGGTHNNAHAFVRILTNNGGEIFYRRRVTKILIENGRAVGVRLDNGEEIEAKVAVIAGVDAPQLVFELVGPEYFDPEDVEKIKSLKADFNALYWYQCALTEHPILKASKDEPMIKYSGYIAMFQKEPNVETAKEYTEYRWTGEEIPEEVVQAVYVDHSLIDTTRAPAGMASPLFDIFDKWYPKHPTDKDFMKDYWNICEKYLNIFEKFHTNITRDKVYGMAIEGPKALAGIARSYYHGNWNSYDFFADQFAPFRPTPRLVNGKMPVEGLYACGMSWQQGGWAGVWNGYTLYKVMAEDLGLPKPWEEKGRVPEKYQTPYKYFERFRVIPPDVPDDFPTPYTTEDGIHWEKMENWRKK